MALSRRRETEGSVADHLSDVGVEVGGRSVGTTPVGQAHRDDGADQRHDDERHDADDGARVAAGRDAAAAAAHPRRVVVLVIDCHRDIEAIDQHSDDERTRVLAIHLSFIIGFQSGKKTGSPISDVLHDSAMKSDVRTHLDRDFS